MSLEPKICPICGESFTPVNKKQLYCSISCKHKANYEQRKDYHRDYYQKNSQKHKDYQKENSKKEKPVLEKTCPICENIFQTHDSRKKYCSDECYKESVKRQMKEQNNKKKHILIKICPVCSQEFETTDSKKIFCSQECYRANQLEKEKEKAQTLEYKKAHIERQNRYMAKKNPPVEKTCPICETVFTTTDSRKKYCSKSCSTKAQSLKLKGKNPEEKINNKELNRLQITNIIDIDFLPPDIETNNKMHRKMKIINTIDIDILRRNMI